MNGYATNTTIEAVAAEIARAQRILITTHAKPDGDAIGSVLALVRCLRHCRPEGLIPSTMPEGLAAMVAEHDRIRTLGPNEKVTGDYDFIIITDTGAASQLEPMDGWIRQRLDRTMIFDHHVNGDLDARWRIVEPGYASTTRVLMDVLDAMNCPIEGGPFSVAEALFLGLATDTGWFRFGNADTDAFQAAARLLEAGADQLRIYRLSEESDGPERLAVMARALGSISFAHGNLAAVMTITREDLRDTGANLDDLTGVVNDPLKVRHVRIAILLTELDDRLTKVSLRSKPAVPSADGSLPEIDVNELAQEFGGGGHKHAAGARVALNLDAARDAVLAVLETKLAALAASEPRP